jgi:hypothetical protein
MTEPATDDDADPIDVQTRVPPKRDDADSFVTSTRTP